MKAKWAAPVCAVVLILGLGAIGQENGSSNDPVLKTRPNDRNTPIPQQQGPAAYPGQGNPSSTYGAPPNAIPDGSRFIIKLKDTLDTKKMQDGKHFKAELREDLVTPSGLIIPKGRTIKGHVGRFEHGYTGSKMQLALDEIETRNGWVPLIGTVTERFSGPGVWRRSDGAASSASGCRRSYSFRTVSGSSSGRRRRSPTSRMLSEESSARRKISR